MKRSLAGLFFLALLAPRPAGATVMLRMELPQLVGQADVIFVGKATKLDSHWSEDRRHIVTDTTFLVTQNVRGATISRTVVVRSLGGVVDGIGMRVSGSPQFRVGDEALLFTDLRRGRRYVTGMMQGVFHILRDKAGQALVHSSRAGLTLARRTAAGGLRVEREAAPGPSPEALEAFIGRVHKTIALCATERRRCQDQ